MSLKTAIDHYLGTIAVDEIDRRIVEGYRPKPQEEDPWAEAAARESIAAEPW